MAATRLIALHINKGKTVAQCLADRTDYSENAAKTEDGKYISAYACDAKTCDEEFLLSKRQYEHITGRTQAHDVIAYQIRQSFKPGEITPEEANKVGYETAMRFTKGKHAFIVATHVDRAHIHNHIIFNSTTLDCTRKFRDFRLSGLALARLSDIVCLEHRLSVIIRKPYGERQKRTEYPEKKSQRDEICEAIAEYAKHDRAEFVRVVQEAQSSQQTAEVKKQRTRLATAKQRVSELEVLLCKIYEDNILGKLSDSRYATLDAQYEKEQSELTAEISVLEKAVKSYEKHEKDADRFIALIDKYENFDKLTIAMLNEFIEKILVHERDRKGSIQTTQEVEIYFNFVGRFVPPAFGEAELTPEELEEIRKREERKDRLHQNYLKRKASGAQKRYEDKIKKRKKAEIEAKKAAIRAEDIAKGVFVPVSSLPQREPMKGVQTA